MARKGCLVLLLGLVVIYLWGRPGPRELAILAGARSCLGDRYDSNRYAGGSTLSTFRPADVVFFDDGDGVAGHVGIVSDRWSLARLPLLIHNAGPLAVEENALRGAIACWVTSACARV